MMCYYRQFGVWAVLVAGVMACGCMTQEPGKQLPVSRDTPFILDVPETGTRNTTTRFQRLDDPLAAETPQVAAAQQGQGGAGGSGIQPVVNFSRPAAVPAVVRVLAWVNNKPIFQDEVFNIAMPTIRRMPAAQRETEQPALISKVLDSLIDSELMMQEAMKKLEKNPKFLEKLKASAAKEIEKNVNLQMRSQDVATVEEFKQVLQMQGTTLESFKRMMERQFIADEYCKVCVYKSIAKIGNEDIRDYYQKHLNEFMQVDRIKWQNIFIAVGPKHPTPNDVRQFAQQLGQRWAAGEDIAKLLQYDDGQAASQKGAGVGEVKGDIRPVELEKYLFALKDGEFGPLVELSTGVHIFRLLKRDHAGPMPLDEKLQTTIGNKLKNEVFDQERRSIIRQLRDEAIIEIDRS